MLKQTNYLTKVYGLPNGWTLPVYEREVRGYEMARKILTTMSPATSSPRPRRRTSAAAAVQASRWA